MLTQGVIASDLPLALYADARVRVAHCATYERAQQREQTRRHCSGGLWLHPEDVHGAQSSRLPASEACRYFEGLKPLQVTALGFAPAAPEGHSGLARHLEAPVAK